MTSNEKIIKKLFDIYENASKDGIEIDSDLSAKVVEELLRKNRFSEANDLYALINDKEVYNKALDTVIRSLWAENDEKAINRILSYDHLGDVAEIIAYQFFITAVGKNRSINGIGDLYTKLERTFGDRYATDLGCVICMAVRETSASTSGFENICGMMDDIKSSKISTISSMYTEIEDSKRSMVLGYAVDDLKASTSTGEVSDLVGIYKKYTNWSISDDPKFIKAFTDSLSVKKFQGIDDMYLKTDCIRGYPGPISNEIDKVISRFAIDYTVESFDACKDVTQLNEVVSHIRESDLGAIVDEISVPYVSTIEDQFSAIDQIGVLNSEMMLVKEYGIMSGTIPNLRPYYTYSIKRIFTEISENDFEMIESEHSKIIDSFTTSNSNFVAVEHHYGIAILNHVSEMLDEDIGSEINGLLSKLPSGIAGFSDISQLISLYISARNDSFNYDFFTKLIDKIMENRHGYTDSEYPFVDKYLSYIIRLENISNEDSSVNDLFKFLCHNCQPRSEMIKRIKELMYNIEYFEDTGNLLFNMENSYCSNEYSSLIKMLSIYAKWCKEGGAIKELLDASDSIINTSSDKMDLCLAYAVAGMVNESDCSWPNALRSYENASRYDDYGKGYVDKCAEVCIKALNKDDALRYTGESNTVLSKLFAVEAEMITNKRVRNKINSVETSDEYTESYRLYLAGNTELELGVSDKALEYYNNGLSHIEQYNYSHARILKARLLLGHGRAQAILDKDRIYLSNADFERAIDLLSVYPETRRDIKMLIEEIEHTKDKINNSTESEERQVKKKSTDSSLVKLIEIAGFQSILITGEPKGSGGRYKIYAGQGQNDSKQYAVRIHKDINPYRSATIPISGDVIKAMKKETELWELLTSECPDKVINLLGHDNTKFPVQVTEWADNSFDNAQSGLSTRDSRDIMITILYELQAIHDAGIVHNDIKPENILQIGKYWKISDFDTSFEEGENGDYSRGTYQYKSPEHFEGRKITSKSDVWAAGVMAYQVLTRTYPFDGGEMEYTDNVVSGNYRTGPLEPKFRPLFEKVFSVYPEERPTAQEFADELKNLI